MLEVILISIIVMIWICFGRTAKWHIAFLRPGAKRSESPGSGRFRCTVQLQKGCDGTEVFIVKVQGRVVAPSDMFDMDIQILLADVTDGAGDPKPVLGTVSQWQMEDSPVFCYRVHNGKIPRRELLISEWMTVATIRADYLQFPRQGRRRIQFVASLISHQTSAELVCAGAVMDYENAQTGYIDITEDNNQARVLTVRLAVAVAASQGHGNQAQLDVIRQWMDEHIMACQSNTNKLVIRDMLEGALKETTELIESNKKVDIDSVGREMAGALEVIERYNAIELCLHIAGQGDSISGRQIDILRRTAELLDIDGEKFRAMAQKILPVKSGQDDYTNFILGITDDMTVEEKREQLNDEYCKWNGRVTSRDTTIQDQADEMLALIAQVRNDCVEQPCANG
ncbi:MAG: hypothetical protein KAT00_13130 [Planctomycetes bacterium]|nr:hypothetical protein [Planctomycetota bacterium]